MPHRIIFDTDPGVDDALALLLALASPELDVLGVTTVFGNAAVEQTTRNAQHILEVAGRPDLPVVAGAGQPLARPRQPKVAVHGADGLGDIGLPPAARPPAAWPGGAAGFIADTLLAQPGVVTVVAVGPLTNLAQALAARPEVAAAARRVIIMGGAVFCRGNRTPVAEANFADDPEAARAVLGAGWPVTLIGLDVTMRTVASDAFLDQLLRAGRPATDFLARSLPVYRASYRTRYALNGLPTHDPSAVAAALDPTLFSAKPVPLYVEVEGRCAGQTVPDLYGQWAPLPVIDVGVDVDSGRLLALLQARLG
ncbi:MAG: nucleoside hydrolase [Anaerolineales bacterium]|nr:nucleoside hydrolase [Anaerolineales bacterium]